MDDNEKFNSLEELYKRLLPAIRVKITELKREKIIGINPIDIWAYLTNKVWKNKKDLRIYELVQDIFDIDGLDLQLYMKGKE